MAPWPPLRIAYVYDRILMVTGTTLKLPAGLLSTYYVCQYTQPINQLTANQLIGFEFVSDVQFIDNIIYGDNLYIMIK